MQNDISDKGKTNDNTNEEIMVTMPMIAMITADSSNHHHGNINKNEHGMPALFSLRARDAWHKPLLARLEVTKETLKRGGADRTMSFRMRIKMSLRKGHCTVMKAANSKCYWIERGELPTQTDTYKSKHQDHLRANMLTLESQYQGQERHF